MNKMLTPKSRLKTKKMVLLTLIVLALINNPAFTHQTHVQPTKQPDTDLELPIDEETYRDRKVILTYNIDQNGTAHLVREIFSYLSTHDEEIAFKEEMERFYANFEENKRKTLDKLEKMLEAYSARAGRPMSLENINLTMTQTGITGITRLELDWKGFAARSGENTWIIGDFFEGGGLHPNVTLRIILPEHAHVVEVFPPPNKEYMNAFEWWGETEFPPGTPLVEYTLPPPPLLEKLAHTKSLLKTVNYKIRQAENEGKDVSTPKIYLNKGKKLLKESESYIGAGKYDAAEKKVEEALTEVMRAEKLLTYRGRIAETLEGSLPLVAVGVVLLIAVVSAILLVVTRGKSSKGR